jgi:serine/threonine protein kinase
LNETDDGNYSQRTLFTEYETIEIAINLIDVVQVLHDKNIVHTNICPENILMGGLDHNQITFLNLFHASWDPKFILKGSQMESGAEGL